MKLCNGWRRPFLAVVLWAAIAPAASVFGSRMGHASEPSREDDEGRGEIEATSARTARGAVVFASKGSLWISEPHAYPRLLTPLSGSAVSVAVDVSGGLAAVAYAAGTPAVELFAARGGRFQSVGGGVESWRRPTRVSLGDVDGDGQVDALVLVTGRARFDHRVALRPFVYGWDGARLYPKWLGSRLSRPFHDATLGDLDHDGRAELVSVEDTRDGDLEIAAYRWSGFGFERVATSVPASTVSSLFVDADGIRAVVDGVAAILHLRGDRLTADPEDDCATERERVGGRTHGFGFPR